MTAEEIHPPEEIAALKRLNELQPMLAHALNSLGGKTIGGEIKYLAWSAVLVNRAAEGYSWLRQSGRTNASKLLVRPALEAVFKALAVLGTPGFLFRLAYTEWKDEKKMLATTPEKEAKAAEMLSEIEKAFQAERPGEPTEQRKVTIEDAAKAAGLQQSYDTAYRLYCKYTHGALRAIMGDFDFASDERDTPIVSSCVLVMLDQLKRRTPAEIPDLTAYTTALTQTRAAL